MFRKIISTITLAAFLFTNIGFAQDIYPRGTPDKLSPPSPLDDIASGTPFHKDHVLCRMLMSMDFDIVRDQVAGKTDADVVKDAFVKLDRILKDKRKAYFENDPHKNRNSLIIAYYDTIESVVEDKHVFSVRVSVKRGGALHYYKLLFSTDVVGDEPMPTGLYPEDRAEELKRWVAKNDTSLPELSRRDLDAIKRYEQHKKGLNPIIKYAFDRGLVKKVSPRLGGAGSVYDTIAGVLNVKIGQPTQGKKVPALGGARRPLYFIKKTPEVEAMLDRAGELVSFVDESGNIYYARPDAASSNESVFVFVSEKEYNDPLSGGIGFNTSFGVIQHLLEMVVASLPPREQQLVSSTHLTTGIIRKLVHEMGVVCNLPIVEVRDNRPYHELDLRLERYLRGEDPGELKEYELADLDRATVTRDYLAADSAPSFSPAAQSMTSTELANYLEALPSRAARKKFSGVDIILHDGSGKPYSVGLRSFIRALREGAVTDIEARYEVGAGTEASLQAKTVRGAGKKKLTVDVYRVESPTAAAVQESSRPRNMNTGQFTQKAGGSAVDALLAFAEFPNEKFLNPDGFNVSDYIDAITGNWDISADTCRRDIKKLFDAEYLVKGDRPGTYKLTHEGLRAVLYLLLHKTVPEQLLLRPVVNPRKVVFHVRDSLFTAQTEAGERTGVSLSSRCGLYLSDYNKVQGAMYKFGGFVEYLSNNPIFECRLRISLAGALYQFDETAQQANDERERVLETEMAGAARRRTGRPPVQGGSAVDALMIFGKNPKKFLTKNGFSAKDHETTVDEMGFTPAPRTLSDDRKRLMDCSYLKKEGKGRNVRYVLTPKGVLAIVWLLDHERHDEAMGVFSSDAYQPHSIWECERPMLKDINLTTEGIAVVSKIFDARRVIMDREDLDFEKLSEGSSLDDFKLAVPLKSAAFKFDDAAIQQEAPVKRAPDAGGRMAAMKQGTSENQDEQIVPGDDPEIRPGVLKASLLVALQAKIMVSQTECDSVALSNRPDIRKRHENQIEALQKAIDIIDSQKGDFSLQKAVVAYPKIVYYIRLALENHEFESDWKGVIAAVKKVEDATKRGSAAKMGEVSTMEEAEAAIESSVDFDDIFRGGKAEKYRPIYDEIVTAIEMVDEEAREVYADGAIQTVRIAIVPGGGINDTLVQKPVVNAKTEKKERIVCIYESYIKKIYELYGMIDESDITTAKQQKDIIYHIIYGSVLHEVGHSSEENCDIMNTHALFAVKEKGWPKLISEWAEKLGIMRDSEWTNQRFAEVVAESIADSWIGGKGGADYIPNKAASIFLRFIVPSPRVYVNTNGDRFEFVRAKGSIDVEAIKNFVEWYYETEPHLAPWAGGKIDRVAERVAEYFKLFYGDSKSWLQETAVMNRLGREEAATSAVDEGVGEIIIKPALRVQINKIIERCTSKNETTKIEARGGLATLACEHPYAVTSLLKLRIDEINRKKPGSGESRMLRTTRDFVMAALGRAGLTGSAAKQGTGELHPPQVVPASETAPEPTRITPIEVNECLEEALTAGIERMRTAIGEMEANIKDLHEKHDADLMQDEEDRKVKTENAIKRYTAALGFVDSRSNRSRGLSPQQMARKSAHLRVFEQAVKNYKPGDQKFESLRSIIREAIDIAPAMKADKKDAEIRKAQERGGEAFLFIVRSEKLRWLIATQGYFTLQNYISACKPGMRKTARKDLDYLAISSIDSDGAILVLDEKGYSFTSVGAALVNLNKSVDEEKRLKTATGTVRTLSFAHGGLEANVSIMSSINKPREEKRLISEIEKLIELGRGGIGRIEDILMDVDKELVFLIGKEEYPVNYAVSVQGKSLTFHIESAERDGEMIATCLLSYPETVAPAAESAARSAEFTSGNVAVSVALVMGQEMLPYGTEELQQRIGEYLERYGWDLHDVVNDTKEERRVLNVDLRGILSMKLVESVSGQSLIFEILLNVNLLQPDVRIGTVTMSLLPQHEVPVAEAAFPAALVATQPATDIAMSAEKRMWKALDIIRGSQVILDRIQDEGRFRIGLYMDVCSGVASEMVNTAEGDLKLLVDNGLLLPMPDNSFCPTIAGYAAETEAERRGMAAMAMIANSELLLTALEQRGFFTRDEYIAVCRQKNLALEATASKDLGWMIWVGMLVEKTDDKYVWTPEGKAAMEGLWIEEMRQKEIGDIGEAMKRMIAWLELRGDVNSTRKVLREYKDLYALITDAGYEFSLDSLYFDELEDLWSAVRHVLSELKEESAAKSGESYNDRAKLVRFMVLRVKLSRMMKRAERETQDETSSFETAIDAVKDFSTKEAVALLDYASVVDPGASRLYTDLRNRILEAGDSSLLWSMSPQDAAMLLCAAFFRERSLIDERERGSVERAECSERLERVRALKTALMTMLPGEAETAPVESASVKENEYSGTGVDYGFGRGFQTSSVGDIARLVIDIYRRTDIKIEFSNHDGTRRAALRNIDRIIAAKMAGKRFVELGEEDRRVIADITERPFDSEVNSFDSMTPEDMIDLYWHYYYRQLMALAVGAAETYNIIARGPYEVEILAVAADIVQVTSLGERVIGQALEDKLEALSCAIAPSQASPLAELMSSPVMQNFLYVRPNKARQIIRAFFGERLLSPIDASDDSTLLVFSEKAAFGGEIEIDGETKELLGLAPFIKKLALSGVKVAVVATTEEQRELIRELNEDIGNKDAKIGCAKSISDIERVRSGKRAPRLCYYRVVGESNKGLNLLDDIREITFERIMMILCKVCGIVPDGATMRKIKRIGRLFAKMA